jgi:hypothetical protein
MVVKNDVYIYNPQGYQRRGQSRKLQKEHNREAMTSTGMGPDWQKWCFGTGRQQGVT